MQKTLAQNEGAPREYNTLYFPLYYNWLDITSDFSDEELGALVRVLVDKMTKGSEPDKLPLHIKIAYRFIVDAAGRVFDYQQKQSERYRELAERRWGKSASEKKSEKEDKSFSKRQNNSHPTAIKYCDFDVEESIQRAMRRTYETLITNEGGEENREGEQKS